MRTILLAAAATVMLSGFAEQVRAAEPLPNRQALRFSQYRVWHGNYKHWHYQQPLALVVPPTANTYSTMGWGVGQTEIRSLHHQFKRDYPGAYGGGDGSQFRPTPYWPSHTDQFGVYYLRGPWGHY